MRITSGIHGALVLFFAAVVVCSAASADEQHEPIK